MMLANIEIRTFSKYQRFRTDFPYDSKALKVN